MHFLDIFYPKACLACKKPGKYICSSCLAKVGKGEFKKEIYSVWKYEGVVRKAIIALKYKFASEIATELGEYLSLELKNSSLPLKGKTILIPVPLHIKRYNWRGFNQAEKIGRTLALNMKWIFYPHLIYKTEATQPQAELSKNQRLRNLSGKFAVIRTSKEKINPNSTYVIFDDVATTRSTIKEISKVLKKAGAKQILGLTIAS